MYFVRTIIFTLILFSYILSQQVKKVAIIGAGLSGVHTAKLLLSNKNLEIDMYESGTIPGGRLQSITLNNTVLDVGSMLFIKGQKLINELVDEYKLEKETLISDEYSSPFGILSNRTIKFELGKSYIYNTMNLVWRYGMSPVWLNNKIEDFADKLGTLYKLLDKKIVFRNIEELISLLDMKDMVNKTISEYIQELGLSDKYVSEMVNTTLRAICNQDDMSVLSAFSAMVKLNSEMLRVKGGNQLLVESIIDKCKKAKNFKLHLNTNVQAIGKKDPAGRYILESSKGSNEYDIIILAAPLSVSKIEFNDLLQHLNQFKAYPKATPLQVTYIQGELNTDVLGITKLPQILFPKESLTSAKIVEIFNYNGLFRLHSASKINANELAKEELFKKGFKVLTTYSWSYAWGQFKPIYNFAEIPGFMMDTRLFYTNAHEVIDSSMECALVTSKNIVNMIEDMYLVKKPVKEDI
jgi:prenylcysteine oxidase/farnesylcysteine lyase